MRKILVIGSAVASIFAIGGAGAGRTFSANTEIAIQETKDNGSTQKAPINPIQQQKIDITNTRHIVEGPWYEPYFNYGVSPKEWGIYLQSTGRQKWVKKSSKKPR